MVKQIEKEHNLKLIDLRLAQCDPTDLKGFPFINKETQRASHVPTDTFPVAGQELPTYIDDEGKNVTYGYTMCSVGN